VLTLADRWIWDFWMADDGATYHLFFLQAPRVGDPVLRHATPSVGHAVSTDLTTWQVVADALAPSAGPAFDDLAIWTGSVVRGDDGVWYLFYTGRSRADEGRAQRVGLATSTDLMTWRKHGRDPLVCADPRWYQTLAGPGESEDWRDPWLARDPDGDGWHMIVTASAHDGEVGQRGVLGHAWSPDLLTWRVLPPLSPTNSGLSQLEVPQLATVSGDPVLLFSCLGSELSLARRQAGELGGVWALRPESLLGPYDVTTATRLTDESLYVGKLVQRRDGEWVLLAFVNQDADGGFVGSISDPMPVVLPVGSGALLSACQPSM